MTREELVQQMMRAVRDHAVEHYDDGGWDVIVEAWDDDHLRKVIGKARTNAGAIANVAVIVDVYADRQADARIEGAV